MLVTAIDGCETSIDDLRDALDASGIVGTWEWDPAREAVRYDRGGAALFAGDPDLAGHMLPGAAGLRRLHPDDSERFREALVRTLRERSVVLDETRVLAEPRPRRLLICGRVFRDASGWAIRGRGVLIDVTEQREAEARGNPCPTTLADPLQRAASLCLEARSAVCGPAGASPLRLALDLALVEIGSAIARRSMT